MTRLGGPLTTDKLLQALAAMGTPVVLVDEPADQDPPYLLGCLLASTEAALHDLHPGTVKQVAEGYVAQFDGADQAVIRILHDRQSLLAQQVKGHRQSSPPDSGALAASAEAAMAVGALLGVQILSQPDRTGQRADPTMLREMLRDAKRYLGSARRAFDRLVQTMRGRGVQM